MSSLSPKQRSVLRRLQAGEPVRRAGAYGDAESAVGEAVAFFRKVTLDSLERRGLVTAGEFWGTYAITPDGLARVERMRV